MSASSLLWTLGLVTLGAVTVDRVVNPTFKALSDELPRCMELLDRLATPDVPGLWRSTMTLRIPNNKSNYFNIFNRLVLTFSHPVSAFSHDAKHVSTSTKDNMTFFLRGYTRSSTDVIDLSLRFNVSYRGHQMDLARVRYNLFIVCAGQKEPLYDYQRALEHSLLFLEAQRSGLLPLDNRVPWRGDSCLGDKGQNGEDLTGGYFTDGKTLKFTFPNAAANTMLAWGVISHMPAFTDSVGARDIAERSLQTTPDDDTSKKRRRRRQSSSPSDEDDSLINNRLQQASDDASSPCPPGQTVHALAAIEWGASYLAKCHTPEDDVYAVVGDLDKEAAADWWERPEDIEYDRPAISLSADNPASDMFAEMAASLAASSVALQGHWDGPQLANTYLAHARRLYHLARENRGSYIEAMENLTTTRIFNPRNDDEDELIWAALWLYRATGERAYLNEAQDFYIKFDMKNRRPEYFFWDDKTVGAQVLLYQMTLNQEYANDAKRFCDAVAFNKTRYTSKGLLKLGPDPQHAFLKYNTWAVYVCLELGETLRKYGASRNNRYLRFAIKQMHYVLGDSGRSYVVGFGKNPPQRPLHFASACYSPPATCGLAQSRTSAPNPHPLLGALVSGPDDKDNFKDTRDPEYNEVGMVGNAGLTSALASLLHLHLEGRLIPPAYGKLN